jgi:hypothetical protein
MQIKKRRVLSPQRYLFAINPDEAFYLAARLADGDAQSLLPYGITPKGNARIPIPRGPATRTNANGKWVTRPGPSQRGKAFFPRLSYR